MTHHSSAGSSNPGHGCSGEPSLCQCGEIEIAGRRYVTAQRLSQILQVSVRTLARWNARRIGPPKIAIGKTVLFELAKLPECKRCCQATTCS
jgi:DNA-binding transcriptional regulator YiaG